MNISIVVDTSVALNLSPNEVNGNYAFIPLLIAPDKERYGHSLVSDQAGISEMSDSVSEIFESL